MMQRGAAGPGVQQGRGALRRRPRGSIRRLTVWPARAVKEPGPSGRQGVRKRRYIREKPAVSKAAGRLPAGIRLTALGRPREQGRPRRPADIDPRQLTQKCQPSGGLFQRPANRPAKGEEGGGQTCQMSCLARSTISTLVIPSLTTEPRFWSTRLRIDS